MRPGFVADLLVVNGNPLENLHVLNPTGADVNVGGRNVHGGGIEWTIKDGIPYHVPTLMARGAGHGRPGAPRRREDDGREVITAAADAAAYSLCSLR